jgi:hypothetical protein
MIIIKILKLDSMMDPSRKLGHGSRGLAWDHSGQHKKKNSYYHSFKT